MKRKYVKSLAMFIALVLIISIGLLGCQSNKSTEAGNTDSSGNATAAQQTQTGGLLVAEPNEEYYLVSFISGSEYWIPAIEGFEEAARLYGVKGIHEGTPDYDVNKAITVLEQVVAKKPAGILMPVINDEALIEPINKAMEQGIPVITFNADAPGSNRYSFLGSGDYSQGAMAAERIIEQINEEGDVALLFVPGQSNHEDRANGYRDAIKKYPNVKLVQEGNSESNQNKAASIVASMLQANPNIKGIFCTDANGASGAIQAVKEAGKAGDVKIVGIDRSSVTLDAIKEGSADASIIQDCWSMGYWGFQFLYQINHNQVKPVEDWKSSGVNPVPPYVDTGLVTITKENVDSFY